MKSQRSRITEVAPALGMLAAVAAVYSPVALFGSEPLLGLDFGQLHRVRIEYAREWLGRGLLPGWFTREFLGSPFAANLQSFPWIPTRLIPYAVETARGYGLSVQVTAWLSALFSYLYARSLGMNRWGAAATGFTFACSGFYASRVMAGQLGLLEAHPAFPLLLWLVERCRRARTAGFGRELGWHLGLALATASVVLAGHPQLPFYAVGATAVYALVRGGPRSVFLAGALGVGLSLFAWVPMFHLIGESSRLLELDRSLLENDIHFPAWRLLAFVAPWAHGWPAPVEPPGAFADPNPAYFWDTVCYVGIAPLLAAGILLVDRVGRRQLPARASAAVALIGAAAIIGALPWTGELPLVGDVAVLRSPARQVYLTGFALALALGWGLHELLARPGRAVRVLVAAICLAQILDLGLHARAFLLTSVEGLRFPPRLARILDAELGDGRVAVHRAVYVKVLGDRDRLGFYESLPLAKPLLAVHALEGRPFRETERLEGTELRPATMARLGARFVVSILRRERLEQRAQAQGIHVYRVEGAEPRARFFSARSVVFAEPPAILEALADGRATADALWLPLEARASLAAGEGGGAGEDASVRYLRPSPDEVTLEVVAPGPGFVRLLEAFHPGWSATLDGRPVPVYAADGFAMAIPVRAGSRRLELEFRTPGRRLGLLLAAASAAAIGGALVKSLRHRRATPRPAGAPVPTPNSDSRAR